MEKTKKHKEKSLFKKLVIPFIVLFLAQAIVIIGAMNFSAVSMLKVNTRDITSGIVFSRNTELQTTILSNWTKTDYSVRQINSLFQSYLTQDKDIWSRTEQANFLLESYPVLVSTLRQNSVNGVFLVLNDSANFTGYDEDAKRWGLCIRDYDPESSYVQNEDIVSVRSPASIQSKICSADATWENVYTFASAETSEFFYKPLKSAFSNPTIDYKSFEYFSSKYVLNKKDSIEVISYSVPLIFNGQPYGVIGVEIFVKYFEKMIANSELGNEAKTAYVFAKTDAYMKEFSVIAKKGSYYVQAFGSSRILTKNSSISNNAFTLNNISNNLSTIGFLSELNIYYKNAVYNNEKLVLIGIIQDASLYAVVNKTTSHIYLILIITTLIGLGCVYIIARKITAPIQKLSKSVHNINKDDNLKLNRLGITEIDGLIVSIEDMHKRVTENFAKTEFFARMSHDMRTPMNAIIGFSDETTIANSSNAQKIDFFQKINSSGKYLLSLINDVLDMSKIENGKIKLYYVTENFDEVINASLLIIEELAQKKGIIFTVKKIENLNNLYLSLDKGRLQQILINILSNAVKFTDSGGKVDFVINELERTSQSIKLEYVISDTGRGISEEFMKKLYIPFSQEYSDKGTGLGLAISKKMITMFGGTIDCKSTLNQGTTFTIVLEHKLAVKEEKEEIKIGEIIDRKVFANKRVLLCEDNEINIHLVKYLLEKNNMLVETAKDGVIAVEKFRASPEFYYDIILMDIRMPNKNGIDATKDIRAMDRKDASILPILALTANTFSEDIKETKKAGMNEHLAKPISPDDLYRIMYNYLKDNKSK